MFFPTSAYQNPRKGTETNSMNATGNEVFTSAYQNPRKGTETKGDNVLLAINGVRQRTKIPVRGLKQGLGVIMMNAEMKSAYQNPRKGTETPTLLRLLGISRSGQRTKIPVRGLKLAAMTLSSDRFMVLSAYQNPRKGTETEIAALRATYSGQVSVPKSP